MLDATPLNTVSLGLRAAMPADIAELDRLRRLSLERLMAPSLNNERQRRTLSEYTDFDPRLFRAGTYDVLESPAGLPPAAGGAAADRCCARFGTGGGRADLSS